MQGQCSQRVDEATVADGAEFGGVGGFGLLFALLEAFFVSGVFGQLLN